MRRNLIAVVLAGLVAVLATVAVAGDHAAPGGMARALELPAHRALIAVTERPEVSLIPFQSDGCSGGLSGVWNLVADRFPGFGEVHRQAPPWEACCVVHDRVYYDAGGAGTAMASYEARLEADTALRACVIETGRVRRDELARVYKVEPAQITRAYSVIADAMYLAVRFGGAPCSGLPWRWGFGYPGCSVLPGGADPNVMPARE